MGGIPPELTSSLLTLLGAGGLWFATWLARKGKREDTRIAESNQSFSQLKELGIERLAEITRLSAALVAARAEADRTHQAWEARWNRQMDRCRRITEPLVDAINALRLTPGQTAEASADRALRQLDAHNEDDHPDTPA